MQDHDSLEKNCELYLFLLGLARMYTLKTEDYNQEVIPRIP